MTIARRLIILLAVPLVAKLGRPSGDGWQQFEQFVAGYSFDGAHARLEEALQSWDPVVR